MRGIPSSYRWRRRLVWTFACAGVVTTVAVLIATLPRGEKLPPEPIAAPAPAEPEAPVPAEPKPLRVTPAIRREVNATLVPFVRHAVARKRPEAAWPLVTPALRAGTTRAQWRRGDIPVFPFPARSEEATGWRVLEAFQNDLLISLLVHARPETKRGAMAFQIELKRARGDVTHPWLVDALIPERAYAAPTRAKPVKPLPPNFKPEYPSGRLSLAWFLLPAALLSLILLVPLGIGIVQWRQGVRADRRYERRRAVDQRSSSSKPS